MIIYFILLLIMILTLYQGLNSSWFHSPKKIKVISAMALFLMSFRYIALIIFFIVINQSYLYLLKPAVFLNTLSIPICGILSIFIFGRNNKIKLKKILFMCAMLGIAYCIVIYRSPANIYISNISGYTIELQLETYYNVVLVIINSIFLIKGIELYNKTYSYKLGSTLIIMSSSITLISVLLTSININFTPLLLADISWVLTLDYALIKVKR